ncbi:hypothetical protein Clacol_005618 [Clathrus columnatus]|uniref:Uncharacterized protein n=1 Tax=Clathrus columnatus TaxID=1419009 RepID=A0AAV5AAM9_9AGAM|nr:hypothetical protein Clacol_005618 [Clathrus columnatus]
MKDTTKHASVNAPTDGGSINPLTADPPILAIVFKGATVKADFARGPDQPSRESAGIWFDKGQAWKIVRQDTTFKKTNEAYEKAKTNGLPIGTVKLEKGTVITTFDDKPKPVPKTTNGYVILAPKFNGKFFQGVTKFKSVLKDEGITKLSPEFIKLKRDFEIAKKIGLQDIQGFFERTTVPVNFTDIHVGVPDVAKDFLDALDALPSGKPLY